MPEDPAKSPPTCRLVFARLVSRPEPAIDLAEAAFLLDPFHGGAIVSPADCQRILDPHAANEVRDRGLLCCQLRRYPEAVADLEQYLKLAPGAEDAEVIRDHLRSIRQRAASMN